LNDPLPHDGGKLLILDFYFYSTEGVRRVSGKMGEVPELECRLSSISSYIRQAFMRQQTPDTPGNQRKDEAA